MNFVIFDGMVHEYDKLNFKNTERADIEILQDQTTSQKQRLSRELGLTVGNVNLSDDLFNEEDLVQTPAASVKHEDIKRVSLSRAWKKFSRECVWCVYWDNFLKRVNLSCTLNGFLDIKISVKSDLCVVVLI